MITTQISQKKMPHVSDEHVAFSFEKLGILAMDFFVSRITSEIACSIAF